MLRFFQSLLVPAVLLGLVYYFYPDIRALDGQQQGWLALSPMALAVVVLLLSLRFNRSRLFFSTLHILLLFFGLYWVLPVMKPAAIELALPWFAFWLPFILLMFSELTERGVCTWWGSSRFVLLLLPWLAGWGLLQWGSEWLRLWVEFRLLENQIEVSPVFTQPVLAMLVTAALLMNGRLFSRPDSQRGALFASLLLMSAMFYWHADRLLVSVLVNVILLTYLIALVQASWRMAYIDPLTALPGRRALNERLLKLSGTYSIAMIDIDHFKTFNDRYGHDAGDEVLRMVAGKINQVAAGGRAYRYGGEEFTVVFSGKTVNETLQTLEETRERIQAVPFYPVRKERRHKAGKKRGGTRGVTITVSMGVAQRNESVATPGGVIRLADRALYRAKKKGRNCVMAG